MSSVKDHRLTYVLGEWNDEEKKFIEERIGIAIEMIKSFGTVGTELTMTAFNKAGKRYLKTRRKSCLMTKYR